MKNTLIKIIAALFCIALPITIASCDGNDSSSNASNSNSNSENENTGNPTGNTDCVEGKTYNFKGTQITTLEVNSLIFSTKTFTESSYDFTVEFMSGGTSSVTGTLDVTKITVSIAGVEENVTTGLGQTVVDETGTFVCNDESTDNTEKEVTIVEGNITTVYKLTFTSDTTGTFEATVTGTQDDATIDATSSGTFTILE